MSSNGPNIDKPLELLQKTYPTQSKTNTINEENSTHLRSSFAKVSIHQPSRKNSVHDIHQITKDDFYKIFMDIQENLSRLRILLETIHSTQTIREEFFKLKESLFQRIDELTSKLSNESKKRPSIISRTSSTNVISSYPQNLVYSIEYFRNELLKAQYLFSSLTSSSSIGIATLNENPSINQKNENAEDIQRIEKDIDHLDEHIYMLNQRYYCQIPDWHNLDESHTTDGTSIDPVGLNAHRLRFGPLNPKLSTTSSTGSIENSSIFNRMCRKCLIVCCFCQPNYI